MQTTHTKSTFLRMIKALNDTNQYGRRHDYAYRHSTRRTESTKELYDDEMMAVIEELEEAFKCFDMCDVMRKKIISKAHQMNWEIEGKADMQRINDWCVEHGPYKKLLMRHDVKELGILVSVFDKVYKHYMNKI
jgi:hypothetical protein